MYSIAFFNNKGGVGKTTLICNLGAYLAKECKKKILIIDADPQSNATAYLLPEAEIDRLYARDFGSINRFFDSVSKGEGFPSSLPDIVSSSRFGVDLVPGHPNLATREDLLSRDWSEGQIGYARGLQTTFNFRHLLNIISSQCDYDLVLIDMGPSLGSLNRSILISADYFLTPMSADLFSRIAIENIISSLNNWQSDINNALDLYSKKNNEEYLVDNKSARCKLRFIGYVMQQYRAKSVRGERKPVKSFETILKSFNPHLDKLETNFGFKDLPGANLGQIPALASLVPMSQSSHAPIFDLGTSDGVVGAHFAAVDDAKIIYSSIARRLLQRLGVAEEVSK